MEDTICIKRGDTVPLEYQIVIFDKMDKRNVPVDLENKDVTFNMIRDYDGTRIVTDGICSIVDDELSWVSYSWGLTETSVASIYRINFVTIDKTSGEKMTFPDGESQLLCILEDI